MLKLAGRIFGVRHIASRPDLTSKDLITGRNMMNAGTEVLEADASRPHFVFDDKPFKENDDPFHDSIPRRGRKRWERWLKKIKQLIAFIEKLNDKELSLAEKISMGKRGRELTEEERFTIKENMERHKLETFHKERCNRGKQMLIHAMTNIRLARFKAKDGNEKVIRTVTFDRIDFSPLQYRYHVDALHSPVNISDINRPDVMTHLSAAVQHPVRGDLQQVGSFVTGLTLTIEIAATLGIPNKCLFSDLLPLIPDSAPPLAFLVGYGENKRPEWRSLEDMPHFLIGGQTAGGKSNFQHNMICTIAARNKPTDVNFLMIDLKFGGIEFVRYEGLPHLITKRPGSDDGTFVNEVPSGIAENTKQGLSVLEYFVAECEKRGRLFKQEKIQNIKIWNRKHRNRRMPELVVVIDELALLLDDPSTKKQIFELIRRSASTARAAGGHIIAATQSANKTIINETIKVNFPGRLCFSTPDASSSILFVGDGSAINLMPAGRGYFKYGTTQFMVQTPLIEPYNINEVVNNCKTGQITRSLKNHVLNPEEVIDWAIEDNASALGWRDVVAKFGSGRGIETKGIQNLLKDMEGNIYTVGDRMYQVLPGGGNKPRIVVRIEANPPSVTPNSSDVTQNTGESRESDDKFPCPHCSAMREQTPCEYCGGE